MQRDPLNLDLPERRIVIGEDGKVKSIAYRERLESMRLIEEFMIQANVSAAETLEKARMPLIFRIHEQPSKEKLFAFSDFLRTLSLPFAKGQVVKPAIFNRILEKAKGTAHDDVMNDVALAQPGASHLFARQYRAFRAQSHALRPFHFADPTLCRSNRASGADPGDPCRRATGLRIRELGKLGQIAEHISMTERRAMAAERDSTDRYVAAYMEDRVGATFDARVTGVTRFGLFVRLPETGAEGLVPARSLGFEYFRHDERRHALVGERSGTKYGLGDILPVRLVEAAPLTGGLRFELAQANGPAKPQKPKTPWANRKVAEDKKKRRKKR